MSGSFRRAFGLWLRTKLTGVNVYSDEIASGRRYPFLTITELAHEAPWLGCGKRDFVIRTPGTGFVSSSGRAAFETTTYRLTVHPPPSTSNTGARIVDSILDSLENVILTQGMNRGTLTFVDTEVTPNESFPVSRISHEGRRNIGTSGQTQVETDSEPFVFRGTLTVQIQRIVTVSTAVEGVFKNIHVEEETP